MLSFPFMLATIKPLQIVGCVAIVVACVALIVYFVFRKSKPVTVVETEGSAPESLVGERGIVTEIVDAEIGSGLVEIAGQGWSARSVYTDDVYEIGSEVVVVAVEGVKLIVRPI